ncbi:MAG: AAA family ATPase [Candidatus Caldarchaeum sp.]
MPVFVDASKLSPSYIPRTLLHRDRERKLLSTLLREGVERRSDSFVAKAQVVGGVGAGKTTLCLKVGQELEAAYKNLIHLYVNLRRFSASKVAIYRYMVRTLSEEAYSQSLSAEELLDNLLTYLKNHRKQSVITFDEADYHVKACRGRETVVYDFTRLHEVFSVRPVNVVGVVFVTRDPAYGGLLEKPELSSLGVNIVKLEPYTTEQMKEILEERVSEAFRRGAVSHQVIEYVADVATRPPHNGDVRFALDVLLYAGNLAESRGYDHVKLDDVRYVLAETGQTTLSSELAELSENEKTALLAVAKCLTITGEAYAEVEAVKKIYRMICEQHGRSDTGFDKAVRSLRHKGFIELSRDGRVELVGADAERVSQVVEHYLRERRMADG